MPLSKFGPFEAAFQKGDLPVPGHLELLNLNEPGAAFVVERIKGALGQRSCKKYVRALFESPNWRPHLVGGIACLLSSTKESLDLLWRAVDAGSWVTPQLIVVAYFTDPQFPHHAQHRVEARCPVSPSKGLSPPERHSATGPADIYGRSSKMLASILAVCDRDPQLAPWARSIQVQQDIREMLQYDQEWDASSGIALSWFKQATKLFEALGSSLSPPFRAVAQDEP